MLEHDAPWHAVLQGFSCEPGCLPCCAVQCVGSSDNAFHRSDWSHILVLQHAEATNDHRTVMEVVCLYTITVAASCIYKRCKQQMPENVATVAAGGAPAGQSCCCSWRYDPGVWIRRNDRGSMGWLACFVWTPPLGFNILCAQGQSLSSMAGTTPVCIVGLEGCFCVLPGPH
jgi:hypothetical protein